MLTRLLHTNKLLFCQAYLTKISRLFQQKKYEAVLGLQQGSPIKRPELRQKFYTLVKKYHSDNVQNDPTKHKEYEEITKILVSSYRNIEERQEIMEPIKEEFTYEDQVCRELFGKNYKEARYWMYEKGNEHHRKAYFDRMVGPQRKEEKTTPYTDYAYHKPGASKPNTQSKSSVFLLAAAGIVGFAGLLFVTSEAKSTQPLQDRKNTKKYDINDIERIRERDEIQREIKKKAMVELIVKDHPPSIKFPDEDPHVMKQLTEMSIAPDIRLYQVPSKFYQNQLKNQIIANGLDKSEVFPITRIKPNTTLTLSLQAQRALQNIYVKVKDVIKQIKTTGKFVPPQVFLKFHGYIMFEVREKPITLINYKDTDYISLFDLFFEHYSPIWLKKDKFCHYLVGKDEEQYFGWVHINTKKCNPVYLNYGDKAAYFHMDKDKQSKWYNVIWERFYQKYNQNWTEKQQKPKGSLY